jgi:haloacetate dehalogenase
MTTSSSVSELFPGFEQRSIEIGDGVRIATTIGGSGPPLLLLHGHPQTRAIWHRVAPALAQRQTLVAPDLRGYGDSSKPAGTTDHDNYSKRVMAQDQVAFMRSLGFAPTLAMYEQTNEGFARAYWHWFFLIQPAPMPERLIEADPAAYIRDLMGRGSARASRWTNGVASRNVEGQAVPCGHYIGEEAPDPLLARAVPFLARTFA